MRPVPVTPLFPAFQPIFNRLGCRHRSRQAGALRTLRQATLPKLEERFARALPAALLAPNARGDHSRPRIFTLARTVWCWLWQVFQANTSCREVVRHVQALFALHQAGDVDEGTGAYCQARAKVSQALLGQVFAVTSQAAERAAPAARRSPLQGRPLRAVDGTSARLADTPANRAAFPPPTSLLADTGFPLLRVSALFSLRSGAVLAQASGGLHTSELRLLLSLQAHLQPGDILLGDRAYAQYVIAALLQAGGVDLLSTVPTRNRKVDFGQALRHLGPEDALFEWRKSARPSKLVTPEQWAALPPTLTVRLLRVHLERPGFRPTSFVLVTTLLDPLAYPREELIATHARRWEMEVSLRDLKTTLGMETLHCQSPAMVEKELLVYLSADNLIRWVLAEAAKQEDAELSRLSFKGALDGVRQWGQAMGQSASAQTDPQELWRQLLRVIAADPVPRRPGRQEPRAVKRRSKYPRLNRPRRRFVARPPRNARRRLETQKRKNTA